MTFRRIRTVSSFDVPGGGDHSVRIQFNEFGRQASNEVDFVLSVVAAQATVGSWLGSITEDDTPPPSNIRETKTFRLENRGNTHMMSFLAAFVDFVVPLQFGGRGGEGENALVETSSSIILAAVLGCSPDEGLLLLAAVKTSGEEKPSTTGRTGPTSETHPKGAIMVSNNGYNGNLFMLFGVLIVFCTVMT